MRIDYEQVEKTIKEDYRQVMPQYRLDDEIEVSTENHLRLCSRILEICQSFSHPIHVLDVGCGTGRYFHCLRNVRRLAGLDLSEDMLEAAKQPVQASEIVVPRIDLIQGNAYLSDFPPASFHFIYSLGMFGHGCPVTIQICEKFHKWLAPGGKLLFNTVDFAGLPLCYRMRQRLKSVICPLLAPRLRKRLRDRESKSPFFGLTIGQLRKTLQATQFSKFHISSHKCKSPLWKGRHLECFAQRY